MLCRAPALLSVKYPSNCRQSRRRTEPSIQLPADMCLSPPPLQPRKCFSPTSGAHYVNLAVLTVPEDLSEYPW